MRTPDVQPNSENATSEDLRGAMEASPTKRGYIRLNAIRLLLTGMPRAAVILCRSDCMVRLWIAWFNRGGIDALRTKAPGGRRRKVQLERVWEVRVPVRENLAQAGVVHWTGVKLHGVLKEQPYLDLGYRTVVRWLHELDSRRRRILSSVVYRLPFIVWSFLKAQTHHLA